MRSRHAAQLRDLHRDTSTYRAMGRGEPAKLKTAADLLAEFKASADARPAPDPQTEKGRSKPRKDRGFDLER